MSIRPLSLLRGAVLGLGIAGCASTPAPAGSTPVTPSTSSTATPPATAAADASLYVRLGGQPAIEAVIDDLLGFVAADVRIRHRFGLADLKALRGHLVDQVCQATGGPCVYRGLDMRAAHKGQRILGADFDALVEDLIKSLDKHGVPAREKGELLAALGGMRGAIVEGP